METIEKVLDKISSTRKKKGLSHENMAFELGISQAAYTNMERNESKLTVERLIRISAVLDKPIYHFFEVSPQNIFHQNVQEAGYGYQQNFENLYQDNKENCKKLEASYQQTIKMLEEQVSFLKNLLPTDKK